MIGLGPEELSMDEAQRFQEEFEATLSMPLDAGARILAKARALRKELDDLTSSNPPFEDTVTSTT